MGDTHITGRHFGGDTHITSDMCAGIHISRGYCDNRFLGRVRLLSLLQQSEGNTLAATEFIRLLEASGSVTAKQSNGTRGNTQILGSNSSV